MDDNGKLLLSAAISYYKSRKSEALASLNVYFNNTVAIADHSTFLDEVKKWTAVLTEAEDNLATLHRHFQDNDD